MALEMELAAVRALAPALMADVAEKAQPESARQSATPNARIARNRNTPKKPAWPSTKVQSC